MSRKSFYKQSSNVELNSITTTYEVEKPAHFTKSGDPAQVYLARKSSWFWWFVVSGFLFLLMTILAAAGVSWWYVSRFERAAETPLLPIIQDVWKNRSTDLFQDRNYKTLLLLGVDQSDNQRENSMLTDTIILAIIRNDGRITMISLPRDLWIDSLKTKINALYYYGQQTNPGDGVTLLSSVITEMSGFPVDYHVVINMDSVKELIDAVGGVEVEVTRPFEDAKYPREINLSSTDPAVLYETIRFEPGKQTMDGQTALKFIRSRYSEDQYEGTDAGREERQQLLLSALQNELMDTSIVTDPNVMGKLYTVWKQSIKTNMADVDVFLLAKELRGEKISLKSTLLPIQDSTNSGIVYHPTTGPTKQWIYMPTDTTWQQFHAWFKSLLVSD